MLTLDHFVIAVTDLDDSERDLSAVLGRTPSWRGTHPTFGTANVLYRLDNSYLELLAPDPEGTGTGGWPDLHTFLDSRGSGLFAIALGAPDLDATVASLRTAGLEAGDPASGAGVDLVTGTVRHWRSVRLPPDATHGTHALVIQHLSPADALPLASFSADVASAVTSILGVSIESLDAEAARRMWRNTFGLVEQEASGGWRLLLENAALLLRAGVGEADAPDRWLRLVLGAQNLPSLADRLDARRLSFEQGDFFEGYGVRLDSCGADILISESR